MEFVALLLTLFVFAFLGWRVNPKYDDWFYALRGWVGKRFKEFPALSILITLMLPLVALAILLWQFQDWLLGIAGVLMHAAILFYALGRSNLSQDTQSYLSDWHSTNWQSAYMRAQQSFQLPQDAITADPKSLHDSVRSALLYAWFEQLFATLFWYILFGPLAALFLRLIYLYQLEVKACEDSNLPAATRLQEVFEWVPARLLGLTFAIAGNFTGCLKRWLKAVTHVSMSARDVVRQTGLAALSLCRPDEIGSGFAGAGIELNAELVHQYANEIRAIEGLVMRALVIWVAVCALLVLL